jgi:hypothetical protein
VRADPISLLDYERTLVDVRRQIDLARATDGGPRGDALRRAVALLDAASEVRVDTAVYTAAPHAALRELALRGDAESLALATGVLDETLAALRASATGGGADPERARTQLEAILRTPDFRHTPDWLELLWAFIRDLIAESFPGLRVPRIGLQDLTLLAGAITALLLTLVLYSTLRGLRAKVTREALLARAEVPRGASAADHLSRAREAKHSGRLREALRELFLAALAGLEQRGALRVDPALTDRELLARAAGSPRAEDLGALVELYERAWYGLREPRVEDVDRADRLAQRIGS